MTTHIIINGREVSNPLARWLIIIAGIASAFAFSAALIFFILPLIGLTLTFTIGLVLAIFFALLVVLPLLAAISVWIGLLSIPLHILRGLFGRKS